MMSKCTLWYWNQLLASVKHIVWGRLYNNYSPLSARVDEFS